MDIPISLTLHRFPEHSKLIGDMLLGFADMEMMMLDMVGLALGGTANDAAPVLYCLRGAEDRLNVANGLLRPFMDRLKLHAAYGHWFGAMRRCKTIRNQYAHCGWDSHNGRLGFANLFDCASDGVVRFTAIDLSLLQEQHRYFQYAWAIQMYLLAEVRFRKDRRRKHNRKMPKSLPSPNLNSAQR